MLFVKNPNDFEMEIKTSKLQKRSASASLYIPWLKSVHFKILSCFSKIVVVFNTTPVDFVLMSADVILKTTTILKEMRIAQISSKNVRTFSS